MKKVIIKTLAWSDDENGRKVDEAGLKNIHTNAITGRFGKPERWVLESQLEDYEKLITPIDSKKVIVDDIETDDLMFLLPADYTIEILDLDNDYDYQLELCYQNRRKEYPTTEELLEAIMEKFGENRPEKFNELHSKRMTVKSKFPKPEKK